MKTKKEIKLTELDVVVMSVMWDTEQSLTIQQIGKVLSADGISVPSVTQAMERLVKKKAVEVCDLVLVGSVYARAFRPTITRDEYLAGEFQRINSKSSRKGISGLAAAFVNIADAGVFTKEECGEMEKAIARAKEI